jgi:OmpA-OmpF porin, OOP family
MMVAMNVRRLWIAVAIGLSVVPASVPAQGGLLGRVKRRVEDNVGRRVERAVDCVMGDQACIDKAKAEGKPVKVDSSQAPAAATGAAARPDTTAATGPRAGGNPSTAVWTNYDFVPGTKTIFFEDFKNDDIGNFPRRYEFVDGNIELVTNRERPWVRFTSTGRMYVPLPAVLPERYTIEMDFWGTAGECWIYPTGDMRGTNRFEFGYAASGGIVRPEGTAQYTGDQNLSGLVHMGRIMVDGAYAKVFVNERRVANVPNFTTERSNRIGFYCDAGMALGGIRVAEGGRKLYDAIAAEGRVATQGIYFDSGSDRIRPESAPTLKEIATMLAEHPELRLTIEGHTDNVGQAPSNLELSKRRAAAVKTFLVATHQIDGARLETTGFGSAKPALPNTTAEGRQTNRRVELVKLP